MEYNGRGNSYPQKMTESLDTNETDSSQDGDESTPNTSSLMTITELEDHFFANHNSQPNSPKKEIGDVKDILPSRYAREGEDVRTDIQCMWELPNTKGNWNSRGSICLLKETNTDDKNALESEMFEKYSTLVYHPLKLVEMKKLEFALRHLGLRLSMQQKKKIRSSLHPDPAGRVRYGEFVETVQNVLNLNTFEDHKYILKANTPKFISRKISPEQAKMVTCNENLKITKSNKTSEDFERFHRNEIERLKRERDNAIMELKKMRNSLRDKEQICSLLEDELIDTQTKEKENMVKEENKTPSYTEAHDQRQSATLSCQLHKAEIAKRAYEVCIEKLIEFVEKVQTTVNILLKYSETKSKGHKKLVALLKKSNDVMNVVKTLTEQEPLPYGWERAYTSDNTCFYINHATQTTTWVHPLTKKQKAMDVSVQHETVF